MLWWVAMTGGWRAPIISCCFLSKYIPTLHLYKKKAGAKEVDLVPFTAFLCDELWGSVRTEKNLAATAFLSTAVHPADAKRCNICKHLCWCSNISWFEAADGRMISRTTSERVKNIFQMKWNFEQRKKVLVCTRYEATDKTPNYRLV